MRNDDVFFNARCSVLILLLGLVPLGCTKNAKPSVQPIRTSMAPARPADCHLNLVRVEAADMAAGADFGSGGKYQTVGMLNVVLPRGTDVMSEEAKKIVRPKACDLGGHALSILASGDTQTFSRDGSSSVEATEIRYVVWGLASPKTQSF